MCENSPITGKPFAETFSKSGGVLSSPPDSGAPSSCRVPVAASRAPRSASSQPSRSMRIRRTTIEVPPAKGPSSIQTTFAKCSLPGAGFAVPSSWPKRFRRVLPGLTTPGERRKPVCPHRGVVKARASFSSIRAA